MSKPALGRGLGTLMNGSKTTETEAPASENPSSEQPMAGPGVSSLLQGSARSKNVFAEPAPAEALPPEPARALIPRWYFFAADILLVVFALIVVIKSSGPLSWKEVTFCSVSVLLGGVLAAIGISIGKKE